MLSVWISPLSRPKAVVPAPETPSSYILVIDDDKDFAEVVQLVLQQEGYAVRSASSGVEGLEIARTRTPSLILCDIHMRDGHGYGVVLALRRDAAVRHVPVTMMTGRGNPYVEQKCRLHGADFYLEKPFAVSTLLDSVRGALRNGERPIPRSEFVIFE